MSGIFVPCLSYEVASGSDITPCIKMDKPLVVYEMLSITTSHIWQILMFSHQKCDYNFFTLYDICTPVFFILLNKLGKAIKPEAC